MNIKEVLENKELRELLNDSIRKTYYNYKLGFIIDREDFEQEVYLFIIPRLEKFNPEKSSIKTYIPLTVMSCAGRCIENANGKSKTHNKLEFKNNTISFDKEFNNDENDNIHLKDVVGKNEDLLPRLIINEILLMESLSKRQKDIILLMSKGFTVSDIALLLHKTHSSINITFKRAKEKIVKKYAL